MRELESTLKEIGAKNGLEIALNKIGSFPPRIGKMKNRRVLSSGWLSRR